VTGLWSDAFRRRVALVALCVAALLGASALRPSPAAAAGPTVSLTAPAAGSTLTGPVVVSASASDDVGVVGVQFQLDGANLGAEDLVAPYAIQWDATTASNGVHTLKAIARDTDGNLAEAEVELSVWAYSSRQATAFSPKPLPIVRTRLGLIPRDYIWSAFGPSSTIVSTGYLTHDRDLLPFHDLAWFQTHHEEWLTYLCDQVTPLQYFGDPIYGYDLKKPAVLAYQYDVLVRAYMNAGFDGIAIDNFGFDNHFRKCGTYDEFNVWHQQYTGQFKDQQFADDSLAWLTWISDRVHADQGLVAINVTDPFHPYFELLASKVDLVYFEGAGFINTHCSPYWTDDRWLRKFQVFRKVAMERGLVIQDETCDFMSQLTPELVSWAVANFFLVRGDRSYFSLTQSYVNRPKVDPDYDGPELYTPLGEPLGEPQQQGIVWTRLYENGLVVVNPSSTTSAVLSLGPQLFTDSQGRLVTGDMQVPPASGWLLLRLFTGGVFVATGDLTGDGKAEIITGPGAGRPADLRAFDLAGHERVSYRVYDAGFLGGIRVAACDFDGDGRADPVSVAGPGGGPHVRILKFDADGTFLGDLANFLAYDPGFVGGLFAACGDLDGDGTPELVLGVDAGGGPHVRTFKYTPGTPGNVSAFVDFFAYDPGFRGGIRVAAGNVDGSDRASLITGAGPGGGPHVRVLRWSGAEFVEQAGFFTYDPGFRNGIFVAAGDLTGDGIAEIVTAADAGGGPHIRVWTGSGADTGVSFFAYPPGFRGGVRVAVGNVGGPGGKIVTGAGPGGGPHVGIFSSMGDPIGAGLLAH
jgi:hypothetical protein